MIPIFLWAFLSYLDAFPGFALRLSLWDLLGTASYTLAFALFESLVIVLPVILLAALLPPRLLKDHFVAYGSLLLVISSLWAMVANYQRVDFSTWQAAQWLIGLGLYLLSLATALALTIHFPRVEQVIQTIMQRAAVLAYVYVGLACVGMVIILIRNL